MGWGQPAVARSLTGMRHSKRQRLALWLPRSRLHTLPGTLHTPNGPARPRPSTDRKYMQKSMANTVPFISLANDQNIEEKRTN